MLKFVVRPTDGLRLEWRKQGMRTELGRGGGGGGPLETPPRNTDGKS